MHQLLGAYYGLLTFIGEDKVFFAWFFPVVR